MKNILEYLWQTDRAVQTQVQGTTIVIGVNNCLVRDQKDNLKWYFYSSKQSKTLKKKPQNTSVDKFLTALEDNRQNGYAGITISHTSNKLKKLVISNAELVDLLIKPSEPFIYIDLSSNKPSSFFQVHYTPIGTVVSALSLPELSEISIDLKNPGMAIQAIQLVTLSLVKALEENLTLGKSKVKEMNIMVAWMDGFVGLLWGDRLEFVNDYYGLGFVYEQGQFDVSRQQQQMQIGADEEWQCQGCRKEYTNRKGTKQVCQQDAIYLRNELGVSKYGIIGQDSFQICKHCIQLLRNR